MKRLLFPLLQRFALLLRCEPLLTQEQDLVARIVEKHTISLLDVNKYVRDYLSYIRETS